MVLGELVTGEVSSADGGIQAAGLVSCHLQSCQLDISASDQRGGARYLTSCACVAGGGRTSGNGSGGKRGGS